MRINGGRIYGNRIMLDGGVNTVPVQGELSVVPSVDTIKEFKSRRSFDCRLRSHRFDMALWRRRPRASTGRRDIRLRQWPESPSASEAVSRSENPLPTGSNFYRVGSIVYCVVDDKRGRHIYGAAVGGEFRAHDRSGIDRQRRSHAHDFMNVIVPVADQVELA